MEVFNYHSVHVIAGKHMVFVWEVFMCIPAMVLHARPSVCEDPNAHLE